MYCKYTYTLLFLALLNGVSSSVYGNTMDSTTIRLAVVIKAKQQCGVEFQTLGGSAIQASQVNSSCNQPLPALQKQVKQLDTQTLSDEFNRLRIVQTAE